MANHVSAPERSSKNTISAALKRRAQSVISNKSIDAQSRAVIRYGLETNDPWLPELVQRINGGETVSAVLESKRSDNSPRS